MTCSCQVIISITIFFKKVIQPDVVVIIHVQLRTDTELVTDAVKLLGF